jgi:LmbE family N-acetylglucosaminyl deacetylase
VTKRLMCVLAHPDDESLGTGGTLAKYAAEGAETYLVTATRGERGRFGGNGERPGDVVVGETRETELRAAARELGVREVIVLGFPDGGLDAVPPAIAQEAIAEQLRRIKPQVVVTFGPDGAYGHPDHIAISQFTTAAVVAAADPTISKLYYVAWPESTWAAYQSAFKKLTSTVDGVERQVVPWPEWSITTVIDTRPFCQTVWQAISCHESQMTVYTQLQHLSREHYEALWGKQSFYRLFSTVNGGRARETDLFEGIRR